MHQEILKEIVTASKWYINFYNAILVSSESTFPFLWISRTEYCIKTFWVLVQSRSTTSSSTDEENQKTDTVTNMMVKIKRQMNHLRVY